MRLTNTLTILILSNASLLTLLRSRSVSRCFRELVSSILSSIKRLSALPMSNFAQTFLQLPPFFNELASLIHFYDCSKCPNFSILMSSLVKDREFTYDCHVELIEANSSLLPVCSTVEIDIACFDESLELFPNNSNLICKIFNHFSHIPKFLNWISDQSDCITSLEVSGLGLGSQSNLIVSMFDTVFSVQSVSCLRFSSNVHNISLKNFTNLKAVHNINQELIEFLPPNIEFLSCFYSISPKPNQILALEQYNLLKTVEITCFHPSINVISLFNSTFPKLKSIKSLVFSGPVVTNFPPLLSVLNFLSMSGNNQSIKNLIGIIDHVVVLSLSNIFLTSFDFIKLIDSLIALKSLTIEGISVSNFQRKYSNILTLCKRHHFMFLIENISCDCSVIYSLNSTTCCCVSNFSKVLKKITGNCRIEKEYGPFDVLTNRILLKRKRDFML
ncbi:hypothetical protein RCL1_006736 [Eukaryota sp. TZLM3-RCL]